MKKIVLSLLMLCTVLCAWSYETETVTITYGGTNTSPFTVSGTSSYEPSVGDYWLVRNGDNLELKANQGYYVTRVEFETNGYSYVDECDKLNQSGNAWVRGNDDTDYYDVVTFSNTESITKITSVTVTYYHVCYGATHYDAVFATCTTTGMDEYWECVCGKIYSNATCTNEVTNTESLELSIDPHNHNSILEEVNEVLATCVSTGIMHHWHCTSCNHNYSDESGKNHIENDNVTTDIAPTNHVEKMQYFPSVAATCAAKGTGAYYYCSHCEKYYTNETDANAVSFESLGTDIDPNNHNGQLKEVAYKNASCTEDGVYHHWHCDACGNDYADANATVDMNGKTVKPKYDADALLVSNSTIDDSYLLGDGAEVTFNTEGNIATLTIGSDSHQYEISESDPLSIEFSHTFKLTAIQDPNNTANYYATFYTSEGAYKLPEGVTAYTGVAGKSGENNVVVLNEIDNIIHKSEAVILRSNSANITLMPSSNKNAAATGNVLTGTDETKTLVTGDYALSSGSDGIGFYKWDNKSVAANNAYLNFGENKGDIFYLAHVVSYVTNVEGKTVPNDNVIIDNKIASEPSITNEGYRIDGWYKESTFENKWDFDNDVVTEDITLYAKWQQQFTVIFVTNGAAETIDPQTIDINQKATAPTVSRTGYKFLGWYTEDTFTNKWDFANDVVTKDITLYAQWIQQFTVSFVTNGAEETIESQTIDNNQKATEPTVSKTGYKFLGWYTEDTFINEWDFANNVVTEDITLYAQWNQYLWYIGKTNPEDAWAILDDEGTLTIYGEGAIQDFGNVGSPFYMKESITEVVFDNASSITSIGSNLFHSCLALENISISNSVATIGESAFEHCPNLTSITLPKNESFTEIAQSAFYNCSKLSNVTIPNSVTTIEASAFAQCVVLADVTIPNSVTTIGEEAFRGCMNLSNITIPENELFTEIAPSTFTGCMKLSNITIPNNVTTIGEAAFAMCLGLTDIVIPNSVTTIGDGAFWGCTSLTELTIPSSVTTIGDGIIVGCGENLKTIAFEGTPTTIDDMAFSEISETPTTPTLLLPNNWGGEAYVNNETPWYGGLFNLAHVVSYNTNSTETVSNDTIFHNEKLTAPTVSKTGYKFLGWFTEESFTNEWDFANDVVTKNITLYAKWIQQFTVAFVTNGAAETIESQTIDINQKATAPTVSKTGYRLDGWYTENTFSNKWDFANNVVTENITLYAQWIQQFTVAFVTNGAAETIDPQTIDNNEKVEEPTVSKTGYRLDGWYTENTFTNKWDFDNDVLTQNTTLYAKWIQQFTIAFVTNGAAETIESQTIDINEKVEKPTVSKAGYKFLGWFTEDTFTNEWDFANDKVTKDITLYAQWIQQITVEFVTNGAAETIESQTIDINEKVEKPTVSKAGYKFLGWFTESTFENQWDFANDKVTKDITLYAQWLQQFTVSFVTNGAAETIESQTIDNNQKVTEPTVSKTGCELRGWYTESTFENKWNFASNVVTANTTLYALWHQHVGVAQSLAATCENDGYAEHFVCECGKAFTTTDCTTEITDLAAWKVGEGKIQAIGHDYVKGDWKWAEDYSEATLEFVCQNDHSHIIPVDADITSKTIKQTCSADGKITYFASALYDGEEYKTTADSIIPAAHIYVVKKWAWAEDFKSCIAKFVCQRDIQHTANVEAVVTTSTNENNQPVYIATATIDGVEYTDTIIGNIYYVGKTNLQDAWAMVGEDGTLTFYGEGDMMDFDETTPPYSAIRNAIKQVVFDENANITSIGKYAFEMCENLTSITIPNTVETIGAFAFAGCSNLKTTTLPEQLTAIEPFTFIDCYYLSNVTIPDGVTTIGKSAFSSCGELKNIIIPNSVTAIEDSAFWSCSELKTITLSENLTTIAPHTFEWCESLSNITIPDGVTAIEDSAFYNCEMLESIIIPNSVTTIGERAFNGCSELKAITLPEKLTAIAPSTFEGCGFTSITIPDGVTTIGEAAFAVCRSLTSITIPNSLTTIENEVFAACEKLADITIPSSVTTIGSGILEYCFCGSVTFEGTPTTIAEDAFKEISIKPVLTLPEGGWTGEPYINDETLWYGGYFINEIENKIFIGKENPEDAWAEIDENGTLTIFGTGETQDYNYEQGSENSPFLGRSNIKNIVFDANSNITALGSGTFMYCPNLTNATIPNTVTSIGASAFAKSNIATITLPDNLTEIDSLTFEECKNLTDVTIPSKVETIGYRAFYGCKSFEDITVPNSVTFIDDGAFLDCKNLKKITLSENIDRIEQYTFLGCESLESITIPSKVTSIGEEAFAYCFNLKSIILPNGLANISRIAFHQCISLESLTIPATVTSVGEKIFGAYYKYDKGNFESLRFLGTPDNIDDNAFNDVNGDMGQSSPIDLYLPFDWSGEEWVDNKTPWYGGYFNLVKEDPTFYIGKDNPEDAWAVWKEDGTFTIYGTGATIDYYDEDWYWTEPAYSVVADRIKNVVFDESSNITSIGSGMFETFENLESIAIPNTVTYIGTAAFRGCNNLESITIPSSVKTIGRDILEECYNLQSVTFEATPENINMYAFEGFNYSDNLPDLYLPDNWEGIPYIDSETEWYSGYFNSTPPSIYKFYIGKDNPKDAWAIWTQDGTFTIYGTGATKECGEWGENWSSWTDPSFGCISDRIKNVVFDESSHITSIGSRLFEYLENLETITIPNTVNSIGREAFAGCGKLNDITIPESVLSIGQNILSGSALRSVTFEGTPTTIDKDAFAEMNTTPHLSLPDGWGGELYVNKDTKWYGGYFDNELEKIFYIGKYTPEDAWAKLSNDGTLTIYGNGETRDWEENSPFSNQFITTVVFDDDAEISTIGNRMFFNCKKITNITLPNSIGKIGASAFGGCDNLVDITIPNGVWSIGGNAFYSCQSIKSIAIPNSVSSIGAYAFERCFALEEVTLSSNMTTIEEGLFWNCSNLKKVIIPYGITTISTYAFESCSFTDITLPSSLTKIDRVAFWGCYYLKSITIPKNVSYIGEIFLNYCDNVQSVTFKGTPNYIDGSAFGRYDDPSHPIDLYLPSDWSGKKWINNQTPWYGGYFNMKVTPVPTKFYIGKDNPEDAWAVFNEEDGSFTIYGEGATQDYYDAYWNWTEPTYYCVIDRIKNVVFDESSNITSLGNGMFLKFDNIKTITIPNSVTSIGVGTFEKCLSLKNITIPNSVTSIGEGAFENCYALTNITLSEGLTEISDGAFAGCESLESISFPSSVKTIGTWIVEDCYGLQSVTFEATPERIDMGAFRGFNDSDHPIDLYLPDNWDGVPYIDSETEWYGGYFNSTPASIYKFYIGKDNPKDAWAIWDEDGTFTIYGTGATQDYYDEDWNWTEPTYYCVSEKIKNVVFDETSNISSIGSGMFYNFKNLESIIIPNSVTSIGVDAFYYCENLESIAIPNSITTIGEDAFENCYVLTNITLSESLTEIAPYTFYHCSNLESLIIPNSVTTIGEGAFGYCSNLKNITIPSKVTTIGENILRDAICGIVSFEGTPTTISSDAFKDMVNKPVLTLPDDWGGAPYVNENTPWYGGYFYSELPTVFYLGKNNPEDVWAELSDDGTLTIYGHGETQDWNENSPFMTISTLITKVVFDDDAEITSLGQRMFDGCRNIETITIPNCVETIGVSAFAGCEKLASITLPENLTKISDNMFDNCKNLTDVTIPNNVTTIGKYAFAFCENLASITLPNGVTTIDEYAFNYCENLASITLPEKLTNISNGMFNICKNLTDVTIPNGVTTIGEYAFCYCENLASITLPEKLTNISKGMFNNCKNLTDVTIPNGVTTIGEHAFDNCFSLSNITIPNSVKSIEYCAFDDCAIKDITIPSSVTFIGGRIFAYCSAVESVTFEGTPTLIDFTAFGDMKTVPLLVLPDNWSREPYVDKNTKWYGGYFNLSRVFYIGKEHPEDVWAVFNGEDSTFTIYGEGEMMDFDEDEPPYHDFIEDKVKKVVFDETANVTNIGNEAFVYCYTLESVTIPNSVTTIGNYAFQICYNLKDITIPSSVTTIGNNILEGSYLSKVTFEGTPTTISENAFVDMGTTPVLTLPDGWTGKPYVNEKTLWYGGYFYSELPTFYIGKEHPEDVWAVFNEEDSTFTIYGEGEMMDFDEDFPPYYFYIYDKVKQIVFDETANVTNIGNGAFDELSVESVTIPNSVTTIGYSAFGACKSLESITIPNSVKTIGKEAFILCENLESVTIPNSVTTIEDGTFAMCVSLESITIPNSVTTIGDNAFYDCYGLENITIPSSVETIGDYAFALCESLESITIPSSVTTIGKEVLYECYDLQSVTFEGTPESIHENAFTYINYSDPIDLYLPEVWGGEPYISPTIPWYGGFFNMKQAPTKFYLGKEHPEDVVATLAADGTLTITGSGEMQDYVDDSDIAFSPLFIVHNKIQQVVFDEAATVKSIGGGVFAVCDGIENVIISSSVETIGDYAFAQCENLESITIPSSVTTIGKEVLYECSDLQSVTFEGTPESIDVDAFSELNNSNNPIDLNLPEVWGGKLYESPEIPWYGGYFNLKQTPTKFFIGKEHPEDVVATLAADGTLTITGSGEMKDVDPEDMPASIPFFMASDKIKQVVFDENSNVISIGVGAFLTCENLESITIPNSVISIGEAAFEGCESLTNVILPETLTKISDYTFDDCYSLKSITIPSGVTTIGDYAFDDCDSLESITIPSGVTTIGEWAFNDCFSLTNVILPETLTEISDYVFYGCRNLESITIPSGVTTIGDYAFAGCKSLESITIPNGVTTIGEGTFDECFSLESVTIPNSVTSIGRLAFADCSSLESVTIPNGVTTIGEGAFNSCGSLESITIPSSVTTIGIYIVANSNITKVTFEGTPESIHEKAFAYMYTTPRLVLPNDWSGEPYVDKDTEWYGGYFDNEPEKVFYIGKENPEDAWAFLSDDGTLTIFGHGETADYYDYESPFSGNYAITNVVFDEDAEILSLGNNLFDSCPTLKSITIPNTVTTIGGYTFVSCYKLKDVTIPNTVTSIGEGAFHTCYSLTNITLPETLSEIPYSAFYYCEGLESITIPSGVTIIGESAFEGCYGLTSITIPSSVTTIGERIVTTPNGSNLQSVTFEGTPKNIDPNAFVLEDNQTEPVPLFLPNNWYGEEYIDNETPWYGGLFNLMRIVAYNTNGGSEIANDTIINDSKLVAPTAPTKAMSQFEGWYKDEALASAWNFDNDVVTKNITLYAKWHLHNPIEDELLATCETDGYKKHYVCECGKAFTTDECTTEITDLAAWKAGDGLIPALNHDYELSEWNWADDNSAASATFVCKNDETHVETVNAIVTTDTVKATCTEKGLVTYNAVATFNGEEYKDVATTELPVLNHDYAFSKWNWSDDKSEASAIFVCKNDETHVETVNATITTDTVKATCTEKGLVTYNAVATFNGEEYKDVATTEIPAINHDYAFSEWTWSDDKSEASAIFICNNDETHVETVAATITTTTVEATCTEDGKITYNAVATFQGEEYKDVTTTELPALNHNYALSKWNWADDKSEASATFVCKNDETHVETVTATVTIDTVKATVDKNGKITYTATAEFQGETYTDTKEDIIPALGHEFVFGEWLWSDDKKACSAVFKCINEKNHTETVDAKVTADTLKATCLADGLITSYAVATFNSKDYKDTVKTTLPALNHDYALGKWTWNEDNSEASVSFVCKNDNSHVENVDAVITTDTIKATCTEKGLITYNAVATFNGEEYKDVATTEIPALNHDYALGKWTWKEDNSEASVSFVCKNDETHVENVDAVITTDTIKATCTEKGLITYNAVATFNGEEYKDVATTELPALNHDYALGKWTWKDDNSEASVSFVCKNDNSHVENVDAVITTDTVKATCTEKGLITYNAVATFNGEEYKDVATTEIPALNHDYAFSKWNWADDNSEASATFVCKNDESHVETVAATITTSTVEATCTEKGLITYNAVAIFNGEEYKDVTTTELPALNHNYALSKWNWADDKSEASATFVCKNDNNHVENVDATITTDTVKATVDKNGKITYTATAEFDGETYTDTKEDIIPAIGHEFVFGKWLWADDKKACAAVFNCINEENHADTVDAKVTADTLKATCLVDGLITSYAVATFNGEDYKDTVKTTLPALNHDYALGKWTWNEDNSEASVSFVCKNDNSHVENVDATITTDTVKATCTEDGKISYFAVATFQTEEYKDTVETVLPAINHNFALDKWLWSDDKSTAQAAFICKNDSNHADTVVATITTDTVKATCTEDGLVSYYAVATFQSEEYKDTATVTIPAINHDYALGEWTWNEDNSEASVSFICKNDNSHVENVDATITTDTVKATCTEEGKISYFAVATFQTEEYKDTVETILPAINHDFALDKWLWSDDKSTAEVAFICKNDSNHADTVVATITTDTVKATCTEDGLVSYYAVATFQSEEYKDTATATIPAINHDFALDKWLWSDDKSTAEVAFICKNDSNHTDTVVATITTDTVKATCTEEGLVSYYAVATFQSEEYKDTATATIPAINHDFALDKWLWSDDKSTAEVVFTCRNDNRHADTVNAVVTSDTTAATADKNGKIVYTATAEFDGETYTDTKEDIIPAIGHEFVFGKWLWADDKKACAAVFNCINEENHADTIDAKVTADTLKATCLADGLIASYAVATFNGKDYKDTITTVLPALNHDYALGKWNWKDDNSEASVSFVCKNDNSHVETVDATITTDTVKATCTEDGKISYFAVATFQSEEYKDTVETVLPAINHDFALDKWLWSDDKSTAQAAFICKNDSNHADTVVATITTDTVKATCTEDGLISYYAVATFQSEEYKDTVSTVLPAINHDYALGEWTWSNDNSEASVSFICQNDETHIENVDAVITTDTLKVTCTTDGKISYFAVATFNGKDYKDTVVTTIPALNHDYALGKWTWNEDNSEASVSFICKNDETHVENIDAVITTDTVAATTDKNGKITYTATAEFDGETYTDTKEDIIPAIGHEFVFGKWLWADDKASCAAVFNCINEENHADTIDAKVTADTLKATCLADGLITSYAVATFNGKDYKDTVTTVLPALNHDYALGEWTWKDDNSAASVSFICNNDETHVENVDATITTDTVKATCENDGLISYFAVATFQGVDYKDTVTATIPATGHSYAFGSWLWSDDKSQCSAVFVCANDKQHTDTVSAVVTSDTTAATLTENGKIVFVADVTYEERNYSDTVEVVLYPSLAYADIIGLIQGTYCLTTYSGDEANRPAKDLYFKFYGTDTLTQGHFNDLNYKNINADDLSNIAVHNNRVTFDYKPNTTFSFSLDTALNTCTKVTVKNSALNQTCILTKTDTEEVDIADIWNIIEGSYINELGKVQNFIMEPDSETGKDIPCFMWVDQFDGDEGFENIDGYFPLAGDEYVRIEKTGNYYDFMVSGDKYFTLTIENDVVTGFMTYGYDDEDVFKGNYKKLAYSDILEKVQGTYSLTAVNGEPRTGDVQVEFEDEEFIFIRNGKTEQKTPVKNISQIMYTSDSIAVMFKDNSMFSFNVDNDTIAKVTLVSGDNVLEFTPGRLVPEAVDELTDNITVFIRNSEIVVSGLSHDDVVTIYAVNGKLLYKQLQTVETAAYNTYGKGIYFVKVGNKTFTVLY